MNRRNFLATAGVTLASATAGCIANGSDSSSNEQELTQEGIIIRETESYSVDNYGATMEAEINTTQDFEYLMVYVSYNDSEGYQIEYDSKRIESVDTGLTTVTINTRGADAYLAPTYEVWAEGKEAQGNLLF